MRGYRTSEWDFSKNIRLTLFFCCINLILVYMGTLLKTFNKKQYDELSEEQKVRYNQFRFVTNLRMERWLGAFWSSDAELDAKWKELEDDNLPQLQN